MRVYSLFVALALSALSPMTQASLGLPAGHNHTVQNPIVRDEALDIAARILEKLVEKNFVATSWLSVKPAAADKNKTATGEEWKIRFNNPKEIDPAKRSVYIFLTVTGEYIAANFTGL